MDILLSTISSLAIIYPANFAPTGGHAILRSHPSAAHACSRHLRLLFCGDPLRVECSSRAEAFQGISRASNTRTFPKPPDWDQKAEWVRARLRYPDIYGYPDRMMMMRDGREFAGLLDHGLSALRPPLAGRHPASHPHRHPLDRTGRDASTAPTISIIGRRFTGLRWGIGIWATPKPNSCANTCCAAGSSWSTTFTAPSPTTASRSGRLSLASMSKVFPEPPN